MRRHHLLGQPAVRCTGRVLWAWGDSLWSRVLCSKHAMPQRSVCSGRISLVRWHHLRAWYCVCWWRCVLPSRQRLLRRDLLRRGQSVCQRPLPAAWQSRVWRQRLHAGPDLFRGRLLQPGRAGLCWRLLWRRHDLYQRPVCATGQPALWRIDLSDAKLLRRSIQAAVLSSGSACLCWHLL